MIIGYARISTKEQKTELQLDALKAAQCERVFTDVMSGSRDDRPQLAKCLKFLQKGDVLVCWKIDRIGRSLRHLVNTVYDLEAKGIGFKVVTAPIDTTTAEGKLIFGIFASLAEFERALIKERVNAGIKAAKDRGVKFGPPKKLTPYMLDQAKAMMQYESVSKVAERLSIGRSTLYGALS